MGSFFAFEYDGVWVGVCLTHFFAKFIEFRLTYDPSVTKPSSIWLYSSGSRSNRRISRTIIHHILPTHNRTLLIPNRLSITIHLKPLNRIGSTHITIPLFGGRTAWFRRCIGSLQHV